MIDKAGVLGFEQNRALEILTGSGQDFPSLAPW
jgi:hypothetical protein